MTSEKLLHNIIEETKQHLGQKADEETIKQVVRETVRQLENGQADLIAEHKGSFKYLHKTEGLIIVTAYGVNQPGIIFAITKILAECECNIQDISQKLMQDFFTLIMVVDIKTAICPFGILKEKLDGVGQKTGIHVIAQHEDVFRAMHRV